MSIKIDKILSYLIIFIPITLITGPLIPEIIIFITVLLFLYLVFIYKKFSYFKNIYSYFFLLFFVCINLKSFFVEDIFLSLKSTFFYFRFYLLSLAVWYVLDVNKKFPKHFLNFFLISLFFLIFDSLVQFLLGNNILGWEKIHPLRISGFFGDELVLGSFLVRFLPLVVGLYVFINYEKFKFKKILFLFFIIFFIYMGIIISGDRTAFYLSLLFLPFLIQLRHISYFKNKIFYIGIIFVFILSASIMSNENLKNRLIKSTINSIISKSNNNEFKITLFSHNHESHIKTAIKIFKDNKMTGVGVKQFRNFCNVKKYYIDKHSCATHPHNVYAQVLSELGIIGFSFLITYLFYIILNIFRAILNKNKTTKTFLNIFVLSAILINLFPFAPSGNFFNNWLSIIYFFPLGFYFYSRKIQ